MSGAAEEAAGALLAPPALSKAGTQARASGAEQFLSTSLHPTGAGLGEHVAPCRASAPILSQRIYFPKMEAKAELIYFGWRHAEQGK